MTIIHYAILILLLTLVPRSTCLNALFISVGAAAYVTPMFELAKTMKNHNVTFLTQKMATSYVDCNSASSPLFRVIYSNDSSDAFSYEKSLEQKLILTIGDYSMLEAFPKVALILGDLVTPLLHKTIHVLMVDRFDVIVAGKMVMGIPVLCERTRTPCVVHSLVTYPNILDFNLPNTFSFLSSKQLSQFSYRIYNAIFNIRVAIKLIPKMVPPFYTIFQSLPQVPGPFYNSYTVKNLLSSKAKYLDLVTKPSTFDTPLHTHHYVKYLGTFVDETPVDDSDDVLTIWIKSKPTRSILFGAFGSSSLIPYDRMYNLINGLGMFLLQTDNSFLLLALRNANYDIYHAVFKDLPNDDIRNILENKQRVWIEKGFVQQKWILQQKSVKVFLSHCGMGSASEGLYFGKPILGMPFSAEQFSNAIAIQNRNVGQSLFEPPSLMQNLLNPYDVLNYTFTVESVTKKVLNLWTDEIYGKTAGEMSLELKHAGGVKRAVEEIEFFVALNGDLNCFAPFQSTLSFYQRYTLDLLLVFVILPALIIVYVSSKCCKRRQKTKTD